jgi:hypothetical protein
MAAKKNLDLAGALDAMRKAPGRGKGRKSAIYQWMAARYDALAAAFAEEPPSWTGLAKYFADGGLMGTDGLPPTPAAVRATWLRVASSMERKRQGTPPTPPAPQPRAGPPPDPAHAQDDEPAGDTPLPDDFEFRPIQEGKR